MDYRKLLSFSAFAAVVIIVLTLASSCTGNQKARSYGGTETIKLQPGQKLVTATWKNTDLWYLTEPMDSTYEPKRKYFSESSDYGVWEGTIIFEESK